MQKSISFYQLKNIENWQLLTPIKEKTFGVNSLNRLIHKTYRSNFIRAIKEAENHSFNDSKNYKKILQTNRCSRK